MAGAVTDTVFQYTMSTPGDVTTLSYTGKSFDTEFSVNIDSIYLNSDETKLWAADSSTDEIKQFTLTTAGDISTAVADGRVFDPTGQVDATYGSYAMQFDSTSSTLWILDPSINRTVYQYTVPAINGAAIAVAAGSSSFQQYGGSEQSSDPSDPAEGEHVIWQSDGTGSGDDGDIMMKVTAGGSTKTVTIVDFSAS